MCGKKDKCLDIVKVLKKLKSDVLKMECGVCTRDVEHWNNLVVIVDKIDAIIHYIQLSRS